MPDTNTLPHALRRIALAIPVASLALSTAGCSLPWLGGVEAGQEAVATPISLPLYLAGTDYDQCDELMANYYGNPAIVTCDETSGRHAETDDMSMAIQLWARLRNVEVAAGVEWPDDELGGEADVTAIRFVWPDGKEYSFAFRSTGWFYGNPGACVAVTNPQVVQSVFDMTADNFGRGADAPAVAIPQGEEGDRDAARELYGDDWEYQGERLTTLGAVNNLWVWDLDGDGEGDPIGFAFEDNGLEAPSNMRVTCYKPDVADGWIHGAYEILGVKGGHDEMGSFLRVMYKEGDAISHESSAMCLIRLIEGSVIVQEL